MIYGKQGFLEHEATILQEDIFSDLPTAEFDAMNSYASEKGKMTAVLSPLH